MSSDKFKTYGMELNSTEISDFLDYSNMPYYAVAIDVLYLILIFFPK